MRFGGLVAVDDLIVCGAARRHHRADRAERRRQDHGVQLHHRLLQAERRHDPPAASRRHGVPAGAAARFSHRQARARRPHVPEHPAVSRHDRAGKPGGGAAQRPDGGLRLHLRRAAWACKPTRAAERAAIDKARYWLDRTALLRRADDPAGSLAYGEQRRLEIARAMCTDPVLLCLDEPAAGLNARESGELNALLQFIRSEHGISILLIEHDMSVVMEISDHIVVLDYGVKIADGTPRPIRIDPEGDRRLSRRRGRRGGDGGSGGGAVTATAARHPRRQDLLRQHHGAEGRRPRRQRGRDRHADRRQRRRQIDADDDDLRQPSRRAKARSCFDGRDITRMPTHEIAKLRIAQSPEGRRIFPRMTVLENLQMGATISRPGAFRERSQARLRRCFRCWSGACTSAAARCRAASSRCWRSRAR